MKASAIYWRLFDFLVRRIVAISFIVGGLMVAGSSFSSLLPGGGILVNGQPNTDIVFRLLGVLAPLVVVIMGIALFRSRPFNPESHMKRKDTVI
jgi:hypothetical protein